MGSGYYRHIPGGKPLALGVKSVAKIGIKGGGSTLSRNGAFREAKEKAGILRSQHPDRVYRETLTDQSRHIKGRVYEFKRQDGSTVTIREHSLGHEKGNHAPHFNSEIRDVNGIKQSLNSGIDSHTYFKR